MKTLDHMLPRFAALTVMLLLLVGLPGRALAGDEDIWSLEDVYAPTAPDAGAAEVDAYKARLKWQALVLRRLQTSSVAPYGCDTADPCGGDDIILSFSVDAEGRLFDQNFIHSSRSDARDTAALATLNHVNPLPAPPLLAGEEDVTFEATIKRVKKPDGPALLPEHSNVNPSLLRPQRW
jgi:hypothetical protein